MKPFIKSNNVFVGGVCIPLREWERLDQDEKLEIALQPGRDLPFAYAAARIKEMDPAFRERNETAVRACLRWARNREAACGLWIHGAVGVGKTWTLAASVAERVLETEQRYLWMSEAEFYRGVSDSYSGGSSIIGRLARRAGERKCVVIDDLGSMRPMPWRVEQLDDLIDLLYTHGFLLSVTSNYLPADLVERGSISERAGSRLRELVYPVKITGEDRRKKPRAAR